MKINVTVPFSADRGLSISNCISHMAYDLSVAQIQLQWHPISMALCLLDCTAYAFEDFAYHNRIRITLAKLK